MSEDDGWNIFPLRGNIHSIVHQIGRKGKTQSRKVTTILTLTMRLEWTKKGEETRRRMGCEIERKKKKKKKKKKETVFSCFLVFSFLQNKQPPAVSLCSMFMRPQRGSSAR